MNGMGIRCSIEARARYRSKYEGHDGTASWWPAIDGTRGRRCCRKTGLPDPTRASSASIDSAGCSSPRSSSPSSRRLALPSSIVRCQLQGDPGPGRRRERAATAKRLELLQIPDSSPEDDDPQHEPTYLYLQSHPTPTPGPSVHCISALQGSLGTYRLQLPELFPSPRHLASPPSARLVSSVCGDNAPESSP